MIFFTAIMSFYGRSEDEYIAIIRALRREIVELEAKVDTLRKQRNKALDERDEAIDDILKLTENFGSMEIPAASEVTPSG